MENLSERVFVEVKLGTLVDEFLDMEPRLGSQVSVQRMLDGSVERKLNGDGKMDEQLE
jgi:hypothetical protein